MTTDETEEHEKKNAERHVGEFSAMYTLKQQIAKGGYGTVWTANPISDRENEYAVKVIDKSKLEDKNVHRKKCEGAYNDSS